jgi:hypothetical protein
LGIAMKFIAAGDEHTWQYPDPNDWLHFSLLQS